GRRRLTAARLIPNRWSVVRGRWSVVGLSWVRCPCSVVRCLLSALIPPPPAVALVAARFSYRRPPHFRFHQERLRDVTVQVAEVAVFGGVLDLPIDHQMVAVGVDLEHVGAAAAGSDEIDYADAHADDLGGAQRDLLGFLTDVVQETVASTEGDVDDPV